VQVGQLEAEKAGVKGAYDKAFDDGQVCVRDSSNELDLLACNKIYGLHMTGLAWCSNQLGKLVPVSKVRVEQERISINSSRMRNLSVLGIPSCC
jgi:hypothetical protein